MPSATALEQENHQRDADFNKAMHKESVKTVGLKAYMAKDKGAQKAAVDEYFKHFDNKTAKEETAADRESRTAEYATLTRQYVSPFLDAQGAGRIGSEQ
jgi:sterol 24-C-methyltransferase